MNGSVPVGSSLPQRCPRVEIDVQFRLFEALNTCCDNLSIEKSAAAQTLQILDAGVNILCARTNNKHAVSSVQKHFRDILG